MNEAWLIGSAARLAPLLRDGLAGLGLVVRELDGPPPDAQPPALVVVTGDDGALAAVSADDGLAGVPVLVAAGEDDLAGGALAPGHELIVAPFSAAELAVRVARARGEGAAAAEPGDGAVLRTGSLELHTATYEVRVDGRPIDFTFMEYELLRFFVTHPGRVHTRDALLAQVWGSDYAGGARTVDVHVRRLRAKLGNEHADRIRTVRRVGYRWDGRVR